jgi:hypothetical protein
MSTSWEVVMVFWVLYFLPASASAWMLTDLVAMHGLQGLALHYPFGFLHFWDIKDSVCETVLPHFFQQEQSWSGLTGNATSVCLYSKERGETLCADWTDWAGHPGTHQTSRFRVPREVDQLKLLRLHEEGYCVIFGPLGKVRCEGTSHSMPDVVPVGLEHVQQLRLSRDQACAITEEGRLSCWGSSLRATYESEHGFDDADLHESHFMVPETWKKLGSTAEVALGDGFKCALAPTGRVECWGDIEKISLKGVRRLLARDGFACVLQDHVKGVHCWGDMPEGLESCLPRDLWLEDFIVGEGMMCYLDANSGLYCRLTQKDSAWKKRGSFG